MIDTHTHLYLFEKEENDNQDPGTLACQRAFDAGVQHLIFPNVDLSSIAPLKSLASQFPDRISMAMGLHPTEVKEDWEETLSMVLKELVSGAKYVAIGEVGIDLYWDKTFEDQQMRVFDLQVAEAVSRDLPIIIHCREGLPQTLEVLQGHPQAKAVFHSFGGTPQDVEAIRRVGDFYFGINGVVTFKNSRLRESLPAITLDRLLLETDSPYLAPVPHRGKRNESAYLPLIAQHIADHLAVPIFDVDRATTENAYCLFPALKR